MRRLMWFTAGYAAASLLLVYVLWDQSLTGYMIASGLAAVLLLIASIRYAPMRKAAFAAAGILAAMVSFQYRQTAYLRPLKEIDGETQKLVFRADSYSEQGKYSPYADGRIQIRGNTYKIRMYLLKGTHMSPGDTLEADIRLRVTAPEGKKESTYYQGMGIFLVGSQKDEGIITECSRIPVSLLPAVFAKHVKDTILECFPDREGAFAKALLLGDTDDLDYETDTALKISGIRHLVAVSGLHVSILTVLIYRLIGDRKYITPAVVGLVLLGFASAAGFTPSVTRACLMNFLMVMQNTVSQEYDPPTGLSFACLVMMLVNPFVVVSVGFQLSVASVAGILMFASKIQNYLMRRLHFKNARTRRGRLIYSITGSIAVSLGAMALTVPLSAWYFGTVSIVGILTNLLTIWIVSTVFCAIALVCFAAWIWLPAGILAAKPVIWLIRYILFVAEAFSRIPIASVYTQSMWITVWLAFSYICLAVFLLVPRKRPILLASVMTVSLAAAIGISWLLPKRDNSRITVMSVGEGQSILLQSKGKTFLVDCGGSEDASAADQILHTLYSQGIFRLDAIAFTHYDRDHTGALEYVMSRIKADMLYFPALEDQGFVNAFSENHSEPYTMVDQSILVPLGTGQLTLFQPADYKTENENCMCILFEGENCVILITGDRGKQGEKQLLRTQELPDVDILIGGHHGSKNSTTDLLLDAVQPEIVVFSVGAGNSYGHPAKEVLERLQQRGCTVYRTDLQGNVTIRR